MIVFKTFWKFVKHYKMMIILYTVMLIVFGGINMSSSDNNMTYTSTKPDILIVNNDEDIGITHNLISYLKENANIVKIKDAETSIDDALFYRDINYVIYIPANYRLDILNKKNPVIDIKTNNNYEASFAEMILTRYLKVQKIYISISSNENELISSINKSLLSTTNVHITSKLDTSTSQRLAFYFNFASYSIMAAIIYIICLVITALKKEYPNKRTIISSMNYKKYNRIILLSSLIYALAIYLLYILVALIIFKEELFTMKGFIYMLNLLVFDFTSLALALLIANIINNKNAISGIVNVISLGSAFLCGAFIPTKWLPSSVLTFAHIFPSYWYINTNDYLQNLESININSLKVVGLNTLMLFIYFIVFIVLTNIVTKQKRKI